jgi:inner membrane protein
MEPVTQALLGAATGGLVAGRQLGRRSLLFGMLIGMSPDLDVLLGPLHNGYGMWLYHRGTTHSLWFGFVAGPLLGTLLWRWQDAQHSTRLRAWIALAIVALVTHPILDGFTPYGTQLFAPFSRMRFAWNGVAIVDPVYSILLGAGVVIAGMNDATFARRRSALALSLGLSTAYLCAGLGANQIAMGDLRRVFESEGRVVERVRAYPTLFQPWLRHFVVHTGEDRLVGWHSLLSPGCPSWRVRRAPAPSNAIDSVLASWEGGILSWFADGEIGIEELETGAGSIVRIDDLRYAWSNAGSRGAWGLEARFDIAGGRVGAIERFDRAALTNEDIDAFRSVLFGNLPGPESGWARPGDCIAEAEIAIEREEGETRP